MIILGCEGVAAAVRAGLRLRRRLIDESKLSPCCCSSTERRSSNSISSGLASLRTGLLFIDIVGGLSCD